MNRIESIRKKKKLNQGMEWRKNHKDEQKEWDRTTNGTNSHRKARATWYYKNKFKVRQKGKLRDVLKSGNISNSEFICAICGKQPIEKHHENYDLWYVFIPLCAKHHRALNKRR